MTKSHDRGIKMSLTTEANTSKSTVIIDWFAANDSIEVIPRNQARFRIHKDRAIDLLKHKADAEAQLDFLIDKIAIWAGEQHDLIQECRLTLRDSNFVLIAVSSTPACDDVLEDSVSDFDLEIANDPDLNLICLNAIVLPPTSPEAMDSFLDERFSVVFRGRRD